MVSSFVTNIFTCNSVPTQAADILWDSSYAGRASVSQKIKERILDKDFQDVSFSIQLSPDSSTIKDLHIRWIVSKIHLISRDEQAIPVNGFLFVSHSGENSAKIVNNYVKLLFDIFKARGLTSLQESISDTPFKDACTLFSNDQIDFSEASSAPPVQNSKSFYERYIGCSLQ